MRNNKVYLILFFVVSIIIIGEFIVYSNYTSFVGKKKHITYITYGDSVDNWGELKDGATTALKELNGDMDIYSSPIEAGAEGQIELIENALSSNSDAIVIAPLYSSEIDQYLKSINTTKRVIVLSAGENSSLAYHLYTDNESIASSIGENVINDEKKSILIISYGASDTLVEREEKLCQLFEDKSILTTCYCAESKNWGYELLRNNLAIQSFDGIIALDEMSLDAAVALAKNDEIRGDIYGVSNTRSAVYWLDNGLVNNLIYIDEFSLGYMSAKLAVEKKLDKSNAFKDIMYYDVNKENMYEDDLSKVLFPFDN